MEIGLFSLKKDGIRMWEDGNYLHPSSVWSLAIRNIKTVFTWRCTGKNQNATAKGLYCT